MFSQYRLYQRPMNAAAGVSRTNRRYIPEKTAFYRDSGLINQKLLKKGGFSMGKRHISRGDIFHADLNPVVGSEQGGVRPVLIIQNNTG